MGVALLSLATVAETQNLEDQLLTDPLCSFLSMKQWSKEQTVAWAGLEDKAARAAKNSMGCSTASGHRRIRLRLPEAH